MKRGLTTLALFVLGSAGLLADVTVTTTTKMEGGPMAGMMTSPPQTVTRIRGNKQRTDMSVMGQTFSTIIDLDAKQLIVLRADNHTAQIVPFDAAAAAGSTKPSMTLPKIDGSLEPTGRTQSIGGVSCDEYRFRMTVDMANAGMAQMPPEVAQAMKDLKMLMKGSVWMAKDVPGAAEYMAFQKAMSKANIVIPSVGRMGGAGSAGGVDRLSRLFTGNEGLAYMTEMEMSVEGSDPMVAMMNQTMAGMHVTNQVTNVSVAKIADDAFTVPADYKVVK
jgi:hypothetical protein